jgi:hypothetical protein
VRTMRTPDGWVVTQVRTVFGGVEQLRLQVRNPRGVAVGSFANAAEVFDALRSHGVDPAELVDAVGGEA